MAHVPPDLDLQDRNRDRDDTAGQQGNYQANSLTGTVIASGGQPKGEWIVTRGKMGRGVCCTKLGFE